MPSEPLPFDPIAEARRQWEARGWADAAPGMAAVTNVMRAQQLYLAKVDAALKPFELSFARYEVLMLLSFTRRGELPLGKIGARLQVHAASVTNAIDRLEMQRLVTRRPHPSDGRTTLARITAAGRRRADEATAAINAVFVDIGLSAQQTRQLADLLTVVRHDFGDFVAGREPRTG
jgi:DNA-binding MarR family transcriptional regulator